MRKILFLFALVIFVSIAMGIVYEEGVTINYNETGKAFIIEYDSDGLYALWLNSSQRTGRTAIINSDFLTSGTGLIVDTDSPDFTSGGLGGLVYISVDNISSTGRAVNIINRGSGQDLKIKHESASGDSVYIASDSIHTVMSLYGRGENGYPVIYSVQQGLSYAAFFKRDNSSGDRPVVMIVQDNVNDSQPTLELQQDNSAAPVLKWNSGTIIAEGKQGVTSNSYFLCTSSDCAQTCRVEITDGLITGCN